METARRLSAPFIQPLTRLFSGDDRSDDPRRSRTLPASGIALPTPPHDSEPITDAITPNKLHDADLPLPMQDALYNYQVCNPHPLKLSPLAFHTANIVWRYRDSQRVHSILQKKKIISAADGSICTINISRSFAHQFAFLSPFAQRRVIGLLFWWEEEVQRLKGLMAQESEILEVLKSMGENEDGPAVAGDTEDSHGAERSVSTANLLRLELARIRLLMRQEPSQRQEVRAGRGAVDELPAYEPYPI